MKRDMERSLDRSLSGGTFRNTQNTSGRAPYVETFGGTSHEIRFDK